VALKAERRLNNQEYQRSIAVQIQQAKDFRKQQGPNPNVDDMARSLEGALAQVIKEQSTQEFHAAWYVDITNGIMVRREVTTTYHKPRATHGDSVDMQIDQAFVVPAGSGRP